MVCSKCYKDNKKNADKCEFCGSELPNSSIIYKLSIWLSILQVVLYIIFMMLLKIDNIEITHIILYILPVIWLAALVMSIISYIKYKNILSLLLCLAAVFLFVFYIGAYLAWNFEASRGLVRDAIEKGTEMVAGCQG